MTVSRAIVVIYIDIDNNDVIFCSGSFRLFDLAHFTNYLLLLRVIDIDSLSGGWFNVILETAVLGVVRGGLLVQSGVELVHGTIS